VWLAALVRRPHHCDRPYDVHMLRRARIIMIFLLLGAVVNVVVAWGFAAFGSIAPTSGFRTADSQQQAMWAAQRPTTLASIARMSASSSSRGFDAQVLIGNASTTLAVNVDDRGMVRDFGWTGSQDEIDLQPFHWALFVRSGWPLRCMYGSRWSEQWSAQITSVQAGLAVPSRRDMAQHVRAISVFQTTRLGTGPRLLPVGVLPLAFLINTLCYATLLWLLICVPLALRRVLRRRRGLCGMCAYPVGASPVCTECGAVVMPHANTPAMSP